MNTKNDQVETQSSETTTPNSKTNLQSEECCSLTPCSPSYFDGAEFTSMATRIMQKIVNNPEAYKEFKNLSEKYELAVSVSPC